MGGEGLATLCCVTDRGEDGEGFIKEVGEAVSSYFVR